MSRRVLASLVWLAVCLLGFTLLWWHAIHR